VEGVWVQGPEGTNERGKRGKRGWATGNNRRWPEKPEELVKKKLGGR